MSLKRTARGDTIIEVAFAIAIFALVAIISVSIMNRGIATAQASLEITMARNEIDAQAEALRFIHNSFLSEREFPISQQTYRNLWARLSRDSDSMLEPGLAIVPTQLAVFNQEQCSVAYDGDSDGRSIFTSKAFIVNTRHIDPAADDLNEIIVAAQRAGNGAKFTETPTYPRIVYSLSGNTTDADYDTSTESSASELVESSSAENDFRKVARAEGIWVISVRDATGFDLDANPYPAPQDLAAVTPEFFDFHIRTCWYAPGRDYPTTIATIIRLYNPEYIEVAR